VFEEELGGLEVLGELLANGSASSASAAEIFAICIRLKVPSCIRAPPDWLTMTTAARSSTARSTRRVIFSPTAQPIEPPRNWKSIAAISTGWPPTCPRPLMTASGRPVLRRACSSRSR
jgi:hypothetical protein